MVKIYVEEVMKCVMERLTKEYGLTEQQALKEIDMCMEKTVCEMDAERTDTGRKQRLINPIIINSMIVAIATMRMDEDTTVQVHVPMDVEIMQVPPTDKEVEKIKSVLEEETGYKFVSLDSITWDVDYEI